MNSTDLILKNKNGSLYFKKFEEFNKIESKLPSIILYANNGEFIYQHYVFEKTEVILNINVIKANFQNYFIFQHDFYNKENIIDILNIINEDLLNEKYMKFGAVDNFPYTRFL